MTTPPRFLRKPAIAAASSRSVFEMMFMCMYHFIICIGQSQDHRICPRGSSRHRSRWRPFFFFFFFLNSINIHLGARTPCRTAWTTTVLRNVLFCTIVLIHLFSLTQFSQIGLYRIADSVQYLMPCYEGAVYPSAILLLLPTFAPSSGF